MYMQTAGTYQSNVFCAGGLAANPVKSCIYKKLNRLLQQSYRVYDGKVSLSEFNILSHFSSVNFRRMPNISSSCSSELLSGFGVDKEL